MLSLRLKAGEYMTIGDHIAVQIYRISGDSVEVAVEAPREISILRGDVYERGGEKPLKLKIPKKPNN